LQKKALFKWRILMVEIFVKGQDFEEKSTAFIQRIKVSQQQHFDANLGVA
jgi:hypothetical protein